MVGGKDFLQFDQSRPRLVVAGQSLVDDDFRHGPAVVAGQFTPPPLLFLHSRLPGMRNPAVDDAAFGAARIAFGHGSSPCQKPVFMAAPVLITPLRPALL